MLAKKLKKTKKDVLGILDTAKAFYSVNLKATKEKDEKKVEAVLQAAANLELKALETDNERDIEDMFIDDGNLFFNDENI